MKKPLMDSERIVHRIFDKESKVITFTLLTLMLSILNIKSYATKIEEYAIDSAQTPNIIVILVDDLGWSDLSCYGSRIHNTPNIDRLAKRSLQFSDAYAAAPICSPTRASILTGKSPASLNFEFVTKPDGSKHPKGKPLIEPPYPKELALSELTFAEILNPKYEKGFFGKWHLNQESKGYLDWGDSHGPLQQGFDTGSENRGSHPYAFTIQEKRTIGNYKSGEYPEDGLTNEVLTFMRKNKDNPFLLYWSLYYVHTPVKSRAKWLLDKYEAKLGEDSPKKINYAAFVETMDEYVGQVLDEVDKLGITKNTVIIFTSDNGAHPGYSESDILRGNKWNLYEGGIRVPLLISWPGKIKRPGITRLPATSVDLFPTICEMTNTSFKSNQVEGLSLLPSINGQVPTNTRTLYWHFPYYHPPIDYEGTTPSSAIRSGKYKLIYFYESKKAELYNLEDDISEKHDISNENLIKTNQLKLQLMKHLKSVNARMPKPM